MKEDPENCGYSLEMRKIKKNKNKEKKFEFTFITFDLKTMYLRSFAHKQTGNKQGKYL